MLSAAVMVSDIVASPATESVGERFAQLHDGLTKDTETRDQK